MNISPGEDADLGFVRFILKLQSRVAHLYRAWPDLIICEDNFHSFIPRGSEPHSDVVGDVAYKLVYGLAPFTHTDQE